MLNIRSVQYYNDYLMNKSLSGTIGYDNHHVIQFIHQRDTSYVAVNIIHSTLAILLPAENVRVHIAIMCAITVTVQHVMVFPDERLFSHNIVTSQN